MASTHYILPHMRMPHSLAMVLLQLFLSVCADNLPRIDWSYPSAANINESTVFHPAIHPEDDLADMNNLKASHAASLYYSASPDSVVQGAATMELTHLYPAVSLARSHHILSVDCDSHPGNISVTFDTAVSFQTALDDWSQPQHEGILLISYVAGCGAGVATSERSFHIVTNITGSLKNLTVMGQMKTIPIHETVHPDQEIRLNVVTYQLTRPASPSTSSLATTPTVSKRFLGLISVIASLRNNIKQALGFLTKVANTVTPIGTFIEAVANYRFRNNPGGNGTFSTVSIKKYDCDFYGKPAYCLYHREFAPLGFPKPGKRPREERIARLPGSQTVTKDVGGNGESNSNSEDVKTNSSSAKTNSTSTKTNSTSTSTRSIDIYCVECVVAANLTFSGAFVGSLRNGFSQAYIAVNMNALARLVLGVKGSYKFEDSKTLPLGKAAIPGAGIVIPKVLVLGPTVALDIGVAYSLELDGSFSAGVECNWKEAAARIDFRFSTNSALTGDWSLANHCRPIVHASAALTATIEPFVKFSLGLSVSLLPQVLGSLTGDAALVETLGIALSASASVSTSSAPQIQLKGELTSELSATATGFNDTVLYTADPYPLFDLPLQISTRDLDPRDERRAPAQPSGDLDTAIVWDDKGIELDPTSLGQVTTKITEYSKTSPPPYRYIWKSRDGLTYLDTVPSERFMYAFNDLPRSGMGALQIGTTLPNGCDALYLATPPGGAYVVAVDFTIKKFYYLVLCVYTPGEEPSTAIFLTTDPNGGADRLYHESITGNNVLDCDYATFRQQYRS